MASYTTNLNLVKPTINDPFNVEDANSNMQKIDNAYNNLKVLQGISAPTTSTVGANGQFYLDTSTKKLYQCMTQGPIYTWKPVVLKSPELLASYTTHGSFTWTAPDGVTKILVAMIAGGGSGAVFTSYTTTSGDNGAESEATGGASGMAAVFEVSVTPGTAYNFVVGAGGTPVSVSGIYPGRSVGNQGGTTSAFGLTLSGGEGGFNSYSPAYPKGGQTSSLLNTDINYGGNIQWKDQSRIPFGCIGAVAPNQLTKNKNYGLYNALVRYNIFPFMITGGATAYAYSSRHTDGSTGLSTYPTTLIKVDALTLPNGNLSSASAATAYSAQYDSGALSAVATKGTDPGCGGAAAVVTEKSNTNSGWVINTTATSSAGCDGGIFIYDLTNWEG